MKFISLFAGIGGLDLGFERAGFKCVAQVEINDWCQKILTKHWPNVPKFKDVHNVGKHNLPAANVIIGGFPCQDIAPGSSTKSGINGERSGLWGEYFRIICEVKPRWVVVENSSNLISSNNGDDFRHILRNLSSIGYDAEWATISASSIGAYHRRKRVFLLAYDNKVYGEAGMGNIINQTKILEYARKQCNEAWVQTPRDFIGMDDGIPGREYRNRVEGLGNAVVPQVAQFLAENIMKADKITPRAVA